MPPRYAPLYPVPADRLQRPGAIKAKSLGASVMKDIAEVPDAGSFSVIMDPTGAAIGLWQPKGK